MIPRRVWINLAVFFGLFGWLGWWAVHNVVRLDAIDRPWELSAEFASAPGLRPNVEVTYLGVRVGTIRSVELGAGAIVVEMGIQRERDLPEGITAAIRRKSAVGEPYVSLQPPADYQRGGAVIDHAAQYRIPLSATSVPLAYGELFSALDELVGAVPGEDLDTVLDELATALDGRGPALRRLLESGDDLAVTLAERSATFDQLATDLTQLTHTIAAEHGAIGSTFDDLAVLADALAEGSGDLQGILREAPNLGARVDALLQASLDDLGCTFTGAGQLFDAIGDPQRIAELLRVLDVAGEARTAFESAVIEAGDAGADGPYLTGSVGITAADAPPSYSPRPELPAAPSLPACAASAASAAPPAAAASTASGGARAPVADQELAVSERPPAAEEAFPASSDAEAGDQRFPLGLGLLGVGLVTVALAVVTLRPRAVRGSAAPDDDDRATPEPPAA